MTTHQKKFLNVVHGGISTRIRTDGIERIGELQDLIKADFGDDIPASAARIQLYKPYPDAIDSNNNDEDGAKSNALVTDLEDIPEEYFKKIKDGGLALEIRTSPPPSKQSSLKNIIPFPTKETVFLEGPPESAKPKISRSALV
jgi:hypothetical protein